MRSILSVHGLSIKVNNRLLTQDVSFEINPGDAILLSGENGIGKSSILKAIMQIETENKVVTGSIQSSTFGDILSLRAEDVQRFRASIAYVQQKDDYSQMGNIRVEDIISASAEAYSGKTLTSSEVNDIIDEWIPPKNSKRVFDAKSKPAKFSGGEQRLLSVLSIVATRPSAELMLIDEPLNNLDFNNAKNISNMLNKVIKANPSMGLIMISHCRIFPFITREIELSSKGVKEIPNHYVCHNCFGTHNENGYYI